MSSSSNAQNTVREYIEDSRDPLNTLRHLHDAIDVVTAEEIQHDVRRLVANTLDPLYSLDNLRAATEIVTKEEVQRARKTGAPWTAIAKRLGLTRPTAVNRYGH